MTTLNIGTHTISNEDATTELALITVKNTSKLLNTFLSGLFIATRRHLGFKPCASSSPLIVSVYSPLLDASKQEAEEFKWATRCHTTVTPDTNNTDNTFDQHHLVMVMERSFMTNICLEINECLDEGYRLSGIEINRPALSEALIADYWADMLEYAKHNEEFHPNWHNEVKQKAA